MKHPDAFHGKPASQLPEFLTQLRLVFAGQPTQFQNEELKVIYASTLLKGTAFAWIQPYLEMSDPPAWTKDFSLFTAEINATFGDPDIASTCFHRIKKLKQTGSVASYTAEFRRLASQLSWGDQALVQQYFEGLKDPLQDALIAANHPEELEPLIRMATRMDNLQYQRRMQRGQEVKPAALAQRKKQLPYVAAKPQPVFHARPASQPVHPPHDSTTVPIDTSVPRPMGLDATRPRFQRLTEAQKEHRRKNNLCLYCGDQSHFARECPTRPRRPYRHARVAVATFTAEEQGNAETQL
jgi:hypothetical protein